jgi:hypothetical protein
MADRFHPSRRRLSGFAARRAKPPTASLLQIAIRFA